MAKGRPVNPEKARSKSAGNRPLPGQGAAVATVLPPVADSLASREPPQGLSPVAAETWRVILSDMAALRSIREPDLPLVLAYCEAAHVHSEASRIVREAGVLVAGPNGPIANPMIKVQKDQATIMRQLADALGLNPLARIRGNLMEAATGSMVMDVQERLRKMMGE